MNEKAVELLNFLTARLGLARAEAIVIHRSLEGRNSDLELTSFTDPGLGEAILSRFKNHVAELDGILEILDGFEVHLAQLTHTAP